MNAWWETLSPERKRLATTGTITLLAVAGLGVALVLAPEAPTLSVNKAPDIEQNILTGTPPKVLGIEALGTAIRESNERQDRLEGELEAQQAQEERRVAELSAQIRQLTQALDRSASRAQTTMAEKDLAHRRELTALRELVARRPAPRDRTAAEPTDADKEASTGTIAPEEVAREGLFDMGAGGFIRAGNGNGGAGNAGTTGAPAKVLKVSVYGAETVTPATTQGLKRVASLPAGSIMRGVLLSGVDAPTGQRARTNPMPALVRVKKNAILPNRFRADVRECFVIVAATANLSTERVNMRTERLACVRNDGDQIEVAIKGYAVGEDGKAGIRGRLVHRSGSLVAKAAAASFLGAVGDITRPVRVQSIDTSPGATTGFETPDVGEAATAGVFAGASGAMGRLADYYMDLADEVVPLLEVDNGRVIELILVDGVMLDIGSKT